MQVTIVGLSQELSLLDGETTNSMVIELPNGVLLRAALSDEATAEVTKAFVQSGVPAAAMPAPRAAEVQAHPALHFNPPPMERQYSPVVLSDEPDDEGPDGRVFGGDYAEESSIAAIGQQLQNAEASLAHAVSGSDDMDRAGLQAAAARLRQGTEMPAPNWGGAPTPATHRKVRVTKDDMGNPVLQGSGLVDTRSLVGGSNIEEGDVGQV
jgi:hypothetical protein